MSEQTASHEPLNLLEFEPLAKDKLPKMVHGYYVSGSDDQITLRDNRTAFQRIRLRPRMLVGVRDRTMQTTVLGETWSAPLMIAPMAFMGMAHPDGELAMARAAGRHNVPMMVSTMGNYKLEDVYAAGNGQKWFQLYVYKDRAVTRELVERAENTGYRALVVTVDVPVLGRREADIRNKFHLPDGLTAANLMSDEMQTIGEADRDSGLATYMKTLQEDHLTWDDIDWLRSITDLPVLVKGVLRGDDALLALEHGAAGVVVSNHGGRQLDTSPATIDVVQEVADAVGGRAAVLLDGGVRRGTDIIKALAFGADAVLIGRPMMWALAYNGEDGVSLALEMILNEFSDAMALCGCNTVEDITPDLILP
jgi:4-hydroxymandelate oxidase